MSGAGEVVVEELNQTSARKPGPLEIIEYSLLYMLLCTIPPCVKAHTSVKYMSLLV
jgi:hypothetical protein